MFHHRRGKGAYFGILLYYALFLLQVDFGLSAKFLKYDKKLARLHSLVVVLFNLCFTYLMYVLKKTSINDFVNRPPVKNL